MNPKQYKNIIITVPKDMENSGHFKQYFVENTENLWVFLFPLGFKKEKIIVQNYSCGKKVYEESKGFITTGNKLLKYIEYFSIFSKHLLKNTTKNDNWTIITSFPLFCIGNSFFQRFKNIQYIYWIHDYFKADSLLMKIFNYLVEKYNKKLENVCYISQRIAEKYDKNTNLLKKRCVIPNGVQKMIKTKSYSKNTETTCGFIGLIRKNTGLDLIFETLKEFQSFKLEIIGEGYDFKYYQDMAKNLNIDHKIIWHKTVTKNYELTNIIKNWEIGLAPYNGMKDNYTFYGDPAKIKVYFSYLLPVITTDLPVNADEIQQNKAGEIIPFTSTALHEAIQKIKHHYPYYTKGVEKIIETYEYSNLYKEKFNIFLKA